MNELWVHALLIGGGVLATAVVGWGIISPRNGAHSQDDRLHFLPRSMRHAYNVQRLP